MIGRSPPFGTAKPPNPYGLWVSSPNITRDGCVLDKLKGIKLGLLWSGAPLDLATCTSAEFPFSPNFPDNTVLTDHLANRHHLIVASDRLATFFAALKDPSIQFVPVLIRDHQGKKAAQYQIVHPLGVVDCLDCTSSEAELMPGSTTVVDVRQLVVKKRPLDGSKALVRVAHYAGGLLIRADVATAIQEAGFTGVGIKEIEFV